MKSTASTERVIKTIKSFAIMVASGRYQQSPQADGNNLPKQMAKQPPNPTRIANSIDFYSSSAYFNKSEFSNLFFRV